MMLKRVCFHLKNELKLNWTLIEAAENVAHLPSPFLIQVSFNFIVHFYRKYELSLWKLIALKC